MILSHRAWRHRLYFLYLRLRSYPQYKDYNKLISKMVRGDPLALSEKSLQRLLDYAKKHSVYYADVLPGREFSSIPTLTRDIMRERFCDIRTNPELPYAYISTSGGSIENPATFIQDGHYDGWSNATQGYYFKEFLGVEMDTVKNVWLWASERDAERIRQRRIRSRVAQIVRNRVWLSTYNADEERWLECIDVIRRYRPHYVAGYASSLYQMALAARKNNVRIHGPSFVYSAAESLQDFMRDEIEEQFGAKVHEFYGSREVGPIAGECSRGNMHIFVMNNLVEVLNDSGQVVGEGSEGNLVITCLHNYSFPMIRYEINDVGVMGSAHCSCGSRLPYLARLSGRITDYFVMKSGGLVHGKFVIPLLYFRDWVADFQVDQLEFDHFRVRVVARGEVVEDDTREINARIRAALRGDCRVEWEYVPSIDRYPHGKVIFTRCLIPKHLSGGSSTAV